MIGSAVNAFLAAIAAYFVIYIILSRRKKYLRLRPRKTQHGEEAPSSRTEVEEQ